MVVPYPFTRAIFVYGEPISVPREANTEEWRVKIERAMNELSDRADANFDELWKEGNR